jgi:hypothetical protein
LAGEQRCSLASCEPRAKAGAGKDAEQKLATRLRFHCEVETSRLKEEREGFVWERMLDLVLGPKGSERERAEGKSAVDEGAPTEMTK